MTSYPNRTSPVLRGRWLLDNILGAPPPPPPPDVPPLQESGADGPPRSVRERMEAHRKNPACAVCHVRMDPLGFSLENFDALGKWRTTSEARRSMRPATLPDGTPLRRLAGLRQLMLSHQEEFVRTLTEKLLAYALGRSLEASDLPAVRADHAETRPPTIIAGRRCITGIVSSPPFRMSIAQPPRSRPRVTDHRGTDRRRHMMIQESIPRRTMLRGLGATLALPLLDAMVPALTALQKTAATPITRFGVMYVPNGMVMEHGRRRPKAPASS